MPPATPPLEDWAAVLERVMEGDRQALLRVSRAIAGLLRRWNALDFRDDWDDLVQEVVWTTGQALRDGRIRDRGAVFGYLRQTARNRFTDRLRSHLRLREDQALPWDDYAGEAAEPDAGEQLEQQELRRDLADALAKLEPKTRDVVRAVHVAGHTYAEAARLLDMPLGTLKDRLRSGIGQLRRELRAAGRLR